MNPSLNTNHGISLCLHCGGECVSQRISMMLRRSEVGFVLLQNVPADVCQVCGEPQFSIATTGQLMSTLSPDRLPDDVAVVPVYDLAVKRE